MTTIYKCCNRKCPCRINNLKKLNNSEKLLFKMTPSNFKINYQFRENHFTAEQLKHAQPKPTTVNLARINNSENILGLILTFYIFFAISAQKTAYILRQVFNVPVSYQTVLNYAQAAAYRCHKINLGLKGPIDSHSVGDETYIKIMKDDWYVWFFISAKKRTITAYHLSNNRGTQHAATAIKEAIRTAFPRLKLSIITDGNPAYADAIHTLNQKRKNKINHFKVIGLQNLDQESEQYRSFKQIIERLNRTFKHHARPAAGFKDFNGAMVLVTLFVTHYNFLRPHMALKYRAPIRLPSLDHFSTLQERWIHLLNLAAA